MHRKFYVPWTREATETIDFHLRWGWTKLSKLYASEAERRGIPFSYVFILLHTERSGTPSTKLGPKWAWNPPAYPAPSGGWKKWAGLSAGPTHTTGA